MRASTVGAAAVRLAIDEATPEVRVLEIAESGVGDAPMLPGLLAQISADEPAAPVIAGNCDGRACRDAIAIRGTEEIVPLRRNAKP